MTNKNIYIPFIILSVFFSAALSALIKLAQQDTNVFTAAFFRFFFGILLLFPFFIKTKLKVLKTPNLKIHILRVIIIYPSMLLFFYAINFVSIEKANSLTFVVPFITTILAIIFLKEKIYIHRIISLILGFIGMLIIIRPGIIEVSLGVYMILISSFLWGIVIIITKKLSKDDSALTILSYQYIFMFLISFVFAIFNWQPPSLESLIYLFLAGLSGTIFHLTSYQAYKLVDVSLVQPYFFLVLVFASIFGYFIFKEIPDIYTWIGTGIIFTGALIISIKEIQINKSIVSKNLNTEL
ncbi:MAG: DMT family transporter [Alphaproteobacteria bacterium]|nr:DMT family transporter [Alphaproteobacteria bacterium]